MLFPDVVTTQYQAANTHLSSSVGVSCQSQGCLHVQVKAKLKEVQLHKDSPLGDTVLECYNSGSRNVFALGFVPVKAENTVVLLSRDTPQNAAGIKDLNLDLTTWEPLISEILHCCASYPHERPVILMWLFVYSKLFTNLSAWNNLRRSLLTNISCCVDKHVQQPYCISIFACSRKHQLTE